MRDWFKVSPQPFSEKPLSCRRCNGPAAVYQSERGVTYAVRCLDFCCPPYAKAETAEQSASSGWYS